MENSQENMAASQAGGDERQLLQLRQMNSLLYYRPSQSSLYSSRQQKYQPFPTLAVVPGGTATAIINMSDFCYGPTSYLQMKLTLKKGNGEQPADGGSVAVCTLADFWGQNGSCLNVISGIRLVHRSGRELSYIPFYAGQLFNIKRWYEYNEAERKQLDALLNQNYTTIIPAVTGPATASYTVTSMIPMSLLFGEFSQHTQCIPNWLLSGARMDIILKPTDEAVTLAACSYTAASFNFLFDCVNVYDSVQKQLVSEMSGSGSGGSGGGGSGIQFVYDTNFQTSTNVSMSAGAASAFSFDINQANSIVKNVFMTVMLNADFTTAGRSKNAFRNVVQTLNARIGSHYMPSQPMVLVPMTACTTGLNNTINVASTYPDSQQVYQNTIVAFDAQAKQFASYLNTNSVTIDHFISLLPDGATTASAAVRDLGNLSVYGFLLDNAPNGLAYSGQSTNNSRLLNLTGYLQSNTDLDIAKGVNGTAVMIAWTTSLRCANLIGDSLVMDQ